MYSKNSINTNNMYYIALSVNLKFIAQYKVNIQKKTYNKKLHHPNLATIYSYHSVYFNYL